ncbi:FAD:protein FMN transferase [Streptomyces beijiangensis]|uniref:FAD:protein FMN transferase n=1 Tax=Streptomyces beijiangensis TaxID=163361 RepID=A0A939FB04_9ACTN|nr:FAD:protein FMN transferase [Streptomyces beijiangensis]MBO0513735.1 FAD:protein FMN transferase [Streptomyces beijiangensis]
MPETVAGLRHVEHVMGTVFSFDIRDRPTPAIRRALAEAVRQLHRADAVFSTYRADSHISRLDRGHIRLEDCPPEVHEVLSLSAQASYASDGWFSIVPAGRLDPSGLVKGWATEAASRLLHEAGAHHTCVNGGGDIQLRGRPAPTNPWRIGITHPLRPQELAAVVTTDHDLAVATSGTAERGAHIINPHTGAPVAPFASLTVVGPRLTMTDAYATAAFARGKSAKAWLERLDGYEALAILPDGQEWRTEGFSRYVT